MVVRNRLLLHICCAPCVTHCVNVLSPQFDVAGYFYNPNVYPSQEYEHRLSEAIRYTKQAGLKLFIGGYDDKKWADAIKGYENEREGGLRCSICYELRVAETARLAGEKGIEWLATTLTISPHKRASIINPIGERIAEKYGLKFYEADFKKSDGFKISCQISKEFGLYRQHYCGCEFSYRSSIARRGNS